MKREVEVPLEGGGVSALWETPSTPFAALALAHGAGAGMRHTFMEALAGALASIGVATLRYQFQYMEAGRKYPDSRPKLISTVASAIRVARDLAGNLPLAAGGKSMGGRMTSHAAMTGVLDGVSGLVFFGFPLHPPRSPSIERADHLDSVKLPMLFLQGSRDALADLEFLTPVCQRLGDLATLRIIEGADHGFGVLKRSGRTDEDVLDELAGLTRDWLRALPT